MLRSLKDLEKYKVCAIDGDIGDVAEFLFDDEDWTIRYLVADTGGFFGSERMLISPRSLETMDWPSRRLHLPLTLEDVKNSPHIDVEEPVARQHERAIYGYPYDWAFQGLWGMGAYPGLLAAGAADEIGSPANEPGDVYLRSATGVRGYHIEGSDDDIGHLEDLIVDDESWQVRFLLVNTSNWWVGKKVLVDPQWASDVSWEEHKVHLDLSRQAIKSCPAWIAGAAVDRDYEERVPDAASRPVAGAGDARVSASSPPTKRRSGG